MSENSQNTEQMKLPDQLVPDDSKEALKELFAALPRKVELHVYLEDGAQDIYSRFVLELSRELSGVNPARLGLVEHKAAEAEGGVQAFPQLAVKAEGAAAPVLTMVGAPLGEEGRVLIQAIMLAGGADTGLSKDAASTLAALKEKRVIKVFGSASCPYCPGQMTLAAAFAAARPDMITAYAIAAEQYPALSKRYNVGGVPHSVVNENQAVVGLLPDASFASFVAELKNEALGEYAKNAAKGAGAGGGFHPGDDDIFGPQKAPENPPQPQDLKVDAGVHSLGKKARKGDEFNPDLLILGGGPAGLAAAVYAARSGLAVTVLDTGLMGGQVALTPVIENYPGIKEVAGTKLAQAFIDHADEYANLRPNLQITNLEHKNGKFVAHTSNGLYSGRAIIFATGSSRRLLSVPGEAVHSGHGVHYCAHCDGFLYAGKKAFVIGGGNSALTDALHLASLGAEVTLVHRRDKFRGEDALARAVADNPRIHVIWNSTPKEILGDEGKVRGIILKDVNSGAETEAETDGIFVSVGQDPNSRPALAVKAELTPDRHIKVDDKMRTSVPLAYAAGDVTGGFQQVVTATAQGAQAANSAFEDLQKR